MQYLIVSIRSWGCIGLFESINNYQPRLKRIVNRVWWFSFCERGSCIYWCELKIRKRQANVIYGQFSDTQKELSKGFLNGRSWATGGGWCCQVPGEASLEQLSNKQLVESDGVKSLDFSSFCSRNLKRNRSMLLLRWRALKSEKKLDACAEWERSTGGFGTRNLDTMRY